MPTRLLKSLPLLSALVLPAGLTAQSAPTSPKGFPAALAAVSDSLVELPERGLTCPTRLHNGSDTTLFLLRRSATLTTRANLKAGMKESTMGVGYYELFPAGRYGLRAEEWLEVDCGSLKALDRVKART